MLTVYSKKLSSSAMKQFLFFQKVILLSSCNSDTNYDISDPESKIQEWIFNKRITPTWRGGCGKAAASAGSLPALKLWAEIIKVAKKREAYYILCDAHHVSKSHRCA